MHYQTDIKYYKQNFELYKETEKFTIKLNKL